MSENHLSIRLPETEMKILEQYCSKSNRTKTNVIREFIRSLTLTEKAFIEPSVSGGNQLEPIGSQSHPMATKP